EYVTPNQFMCEPQRRPPFKYVNWFVHGKEPGSWSCLMSLVGGQCPGSGSMSGLFRWTPHLGFSGSPLSSTVSATRSNSASGDGLAIVTVPSYALISIC